MDPRLQLRVQRYGWDAAAAVYEDGWRDQLAAAQARLLAHLDLAPGQTVLETAAGTGLLTFDIAERVGPGGRVLASDLSGEMVKLGRAETERRGLTNVTFERLNCEDLSLDDAVMDRAACAFGLMYVPDPLKALIEMKRVLVPGGRAGFAIWGERRKCGWADIFPIVDSRVASEVCPMFFGQGAPGALIQDMGRAGLTDIREERLETHIVFASDADAIRSVIDGGAVAMAAKRFDAKTKADVDDEFIASIRRYRDGTGFRIPAEFVIASGIA